MKKEEKKLSYSVVRNLCSRLDVNLTANSRIFDLLTISHEEPSQPNLRFNIGLTFSKEVQLKFSVKSLCKKSSNIRKEIKKCESWREKRAKKGRGKKEKKFFSFNECWSEWKCGCESCGSSSLAHANVLHAAISFWLSVDFFLWKVFIWITLLRDKYTTHKSRKIRDWKIIHEKIIIKKRCKFFAHDAVGIFNIKNSWKFKNFLLLKIEIIWMGKKRDFDLRSCRRFAWKPTNHKSFLDNCLSHVHTSTWDIYKTISRLFESECFSSFLHVTFRYCWLIFFLLIQSFHYTLSCCSIYLMRFMLVVTSAGFMWF